MQARPCWTASWTQCCGQARWRVQRASFSQVALCIRAGTWGRLCIRLTHVSRAVRSHAWWGRAMLKKALTMLRNTLLWIAFQRVDGEDIQNNWVARGFHMKIAKIMYGAATCTGYVRLLEDGQSCDWVALSEHPQEHREFMFHRVCQGKDVVRELALIMVSRIFWINNKYINFDVERQLPRAPGGPRRFLEDSKSNKCNTLKHSERKDRPPAAQKNNVRQSQVTVKHVR